MKLMNWLMKQSQAALSKFHKKITQHPTPDEKCLLRLRLISCFYLGLDANIKF